MGSSGSATTTSTYQPPQQVLQNYQYVTDLAKQAQQQPFTPYGGEMVAGLTPTQEAGITNVNQAVGAAAPAYGAALGGTLATMGGYSPQAYQQGVAGYMSPYLGSAIGLTAAQLQNVAQQQQQQMIGDAISKGAYGGDRARIGLANLINQQNLALGQTLGQMAQQGYGQAAQNYLAGLGQQGALSAQLGQLGAGAQTAALQGAQAQLAAGAQQQATEQAKLQADYNQFLQQQAYPFQTTQFLANIAEGIGAGSGGTSTTQAPGPNVGNQIFGALGALSLLSDPRAKENMKPVGETYDGQKIYKFNYKGDPRTQIGLNAAEVEHHMPESVSKTPEGLRAVNYDTATKDAANKGHFAEGGVASMGGAVHEGMDRQNFDLGGSASLGDIPYLDFLTGLTRVPTVKKIGGKPTIPDAPKAFVDTSGEDVARRMAQIKSYSQPGRGMFGSSGLFGAGGLFGSGGGSYGYATGLEPGAFADGGVAGRAGYDKGGPAPQDDQSNVLSVLHNTAVDTGIDPRQFIALGREGNYQHGAQGDDNSSFGVYQLHVGGLSSKYPNRGLGDVWYESQNPDKKDASPAERAAWIQAQPLESHAKFSADYIKNNGADPWTVARQNNLFGAGQRQQAGLGAGQPQDQGSMSFLESALGRRLDPDVKMALLTGALGTMASTSPFFGVAVGQGGLGAMANYMQQKQAEREYALGQQKLSLEQQRVGYEGQRVDNERIARGLDVMKFWVGNYQQVATPDGIKYKEISSGQLLTPEQYQSRLAPVLNKYGLTPNDIGMSQPITSSKTIGDKTLDAKPPVTSVPDQHQPDTILTADAYKNVSPDYNPILLRQKAAQEEKIAINAQNSGLKDQQIAADQRAKNYREIAAAIENGEKQVVFSDGTTGFVPEALANLQKKKAAEKFAEDQAATQTEFNKKATSYLENYDKERQQVDLLANIYSKVETNRLADARADLAGFMREFGIDKLAGMDVSQIQSANDTGVKAATTEAFATMRETAAKAPATGLREALLTVASPNLAPGSRYQLVTNYLAEAARDKQMYEDWIMAGKPDKDQFIVQWKRDPSHSMATYQQQAVDQTPLFKGMTKDEVNLLMKQPKSNIVEGQQPSSVSVPRSLIGKKGITYSPSLKQYKDADGNIYDQNGQKVTP